MARQGGATDYIRTTGAFGATAGAALSFHYQNSGAPGAGSITRPLSLTANPSAPEYDLRFYWHNSDVSRQAAAVVLEDSGSEQVIQWGSPTANAWHKIALGVGASQGLVLWINGTKIGASAAGTLDLAWDVTLQALADALASAEYDPDGQVAEIGYWAMDPSDDELQALSLGVSPLFIRPASRRVYMPLVAGLVDYHGNALTSSGTTLTSHSPVYLPARPHGEVYSGAAIAGAGAAVTSHGVFGPRTRRGKRQRHFFGWARRWPTVAADSFNTANSDSLGLADTGHAWSVYESTGAVERPWTIRDGGACPAVGATGKNWALLPMGIADVRIRCHWTPTTITGEGSGLAMRGDRDGNAHLAHWDGSAWRFSQITASGVVSHWANLGNTPTPVAGTRYELELRLLGASYALFVDGVQIGGTETYAALQNNTAHGLFTEGQHGQVYDNFRVTPYNA